MVGGSSLGVILGLSRSSSWSTLRTLMKRLTRMAPKIMPIKIARVLRKGALESLLTSGIGDGEISGVGAGVIDGEALVEATGGL